jgi:hypothetical protein
VREREGSGRGRQSWAAWAGSELGRDCKEQKGGSWAAVGLGDGLVWFFFLFFFFKFFLNQFQTFLNSNLLHVFKFKF